MRSDPVYWLIVLFPIVIILIVIAIAIYSYIKNKKK